jgi:hypothetical protein
MNGLVDWAVSNLVSKKEMPANFGWETLREEAT